MIMVESLAFSLSFIITTAMTALEHFKELIPTGYPFTSPGWSVENLD